MLYIQYDIPEKINNTVTINICIFRKITIPAFLTFKQSENQNFITLYIQ